jgi:hypothetical protein
MSTTFPRGRTHLIADALDRAPNGTDDDHEEAVYLRYAFEADCRPDGPIGCTHDDFGAADRYLDCKEVRLNQLSEPSNPFLPFAERFVGAILEQPECRGKVR